MTTLLKQRFSELHDQAAKVAATKTRSSGSFSSDNVNSELFLGWCVKARSLILNSCGANSEHYKSFQKAEEPLAYLGSYDVFIRTRAVFEAAKEDFEGGYLNSIRNLVQAEVFDSELEQASELLAAGYHSAAAVIAGAVLETTLRSMCIDKGLTVGKLDKMNADLTKASAYSVLIQKRVTAIAAIRNSAAHGKSNEFTAEDVKGMISDIERFLSDSLT